VTQAAEVTLGHVPGRVLAAKPEGAAEVAAGVVLGRLPDLRLLGWSEHGPSPSLGSGPAARRAVTTSRPAGGDAAPRWRPGATGTASRPGSRGAARSRPVALPDLGESEVVDRGGRQQGLGEQDPAEESL